MKKFPKFWEGVIRFFYKAIQVITALFGIPLIGCVMLVGLVIHACIDLIAYTFDKKQAYYTSTQVRARAADRYFAFCHRCLDVISNLFTSIFKN